MDKKNLEPRSQKKDETFRIANIRISADGITVRLVDDKTAMNQEISYNIREMRSMITKRNWRFNDFDEEYYLFTLENLLSKEQKAEIDPCILQVIRRAMKTNNTDKKLLLSLGIEYIRGSLFPDDQNPETKQMLSGIITYDTNKIDHINLSNIFKFITRGGIYKRIIEQARLAYERGIATVNGNQPHLENHTSDVGKKQNNSIRPLREDERRLLAEINHVRNVGYLEILGINYDDQPNNHANFIADLDPRNPNYAQNLGAVYQGYLSESLKTYVDELNRGLPISPNPSGDERDG